MQLIINVLHLFLYSYAMHSDTNPETLHQNSKTAAQYLSTIFSEFRAIDNQIMQSIAAIDCCNRLQSANIFLQCQGDYFIKVSA